ncbi:TetR/AcrR family transcriptional regulator [Leucobacter sp.]
MSRRAKGKEREEIVLEAAGRAISELGFANVRMSDVAERANMTTGHVTYYFPSKTDLLLLAIRRSEETLLEESRAEMIGIDDPVERLHWLISRAVADEVQDSGWNLWLQVWAYGMSDEDVAREHRQIDQRWFELLQEVIEYGCERGAFRTSAPSDVAESISALIDGLSIQLTVGSDRVDRPRIMRLIDATVADLLGIESATMPR